jgi:hypothetical protein
VEGWQLPWLPLTLVPATLVSTFRAVTATLGTAERAHFAAKPGQDLIESIGGGEFAAQKLAEELFAIQSGLPSPAVEGSAAVRQRSERAG